MKGIKNNLIKTGFMDDEHKIALAWNDMEVAVGDRDLKKIFKMAFWIKAIMKKYEFPRVDTPQDEN